LACPRITIVTPSFNQGKYLEGTIRSVLLQGYPNLEYIVMDGGSTDGSVEIIKKYEPWLSYWVSEKDRGQSHAINKGFARASGEVFGWLNSDDFYFPNAFFALMELRRKSPDTIAWVGACREIDGEDAYIRTNIPRLGPVREVGDWGEKTHFFQPSCLFSACDFMQVGGVNENLHYVMDVELWMKLMRRGSFASTDVICSSARSYKEAKTFRDFEAKLAEFVAINVYFGEGAIASAILKRYKNRTISSLTADDILERFTLGDMMDSMGNMHLVKTLWQYGCRKVRRGIRRRFRRR